eukprot:UN23924
MMENNHNIFVLLLNFILYYCFIRNLLHDIEQSVMFNSTLFFSVLATFLLVLPYVLTLTDATVDMLVLASYSIIGCNIAISSLHYQCHLMNVDTGRLKLVHFVIPLLPI